jgi:hypothetical protein
MSAVREWHARWTLARLLFRLQHRGGLNLAQAVTVVRHYETRGLLPLLLAEWEVRP